MHLTHTAKVTLRMASVLGAIACGASLASADEGMWLFNRPPTKQVKAKYGFDLTPQWLEHVQKSAVRVMSGGSGSLVSANGLVMTNHHVGSDIIEKLSTAERNLLEDGFYAPTLEAELKCPDLAMEVLWTIEDVTDAVMASVTADMSMAAAGDAKRKRTVEIQDAAKAKNPSMKCEVVTLYQGGRYHLYTYKRFEDVRLVMAPEKGIAFFGGDPDNFEYPRFNLDMCFFRIWENGAPLKPEHYLKWSKNGIADQDLVFVAGHPGRTSRLQTVAHLEFMRDVVLPNTMRALWRREVQLETFSGRGEEERRIAEGDLFSIQNSRKARTGVYSGLLDPAILAKKRADEAALRAAVDANPEWKAKWGDAWDQVANAQKSYREFYVRYGALGRDGMAIGGRMFGIAKDLVRLAAESGKPSSERLREYADSSRQAFEQQLYSPAPIYKDLEVENMTASLQLMAELLGGDDPLLLAALDGKSPRARAEELVRGSNLDDVEERKKLAAGGASAIAASKDPLVALARALDPEARKLRKRYEDEVQSQERSAYAKIAAALFAVKGEDQYPDATFTLRLAYGQVKGYRDGTRDVPPFTNFAGLYKRADERKNTYPFELPPRWANAKDVVNLSTPFNFVTTCDIIGGNSGSPTIDKNGEVVGLIFDGNIHSLILDIAYDDAQARAVSVDTRSIVESLRKVYGAGALADELTR